MLMMQGFSVQGAAERSVLSEAMRRLRRQRGLRTTEIARRMDMPLRSYERLEAGQVAIAYDRITAFAAATGSDPDALVAAVLLNSPEFALRCADNKMMMILVRSLREFEMKVGDDILFLEPKTVINACARFFEQLHESILKRDLFAETWLSERGIGGSRRRSD
jgi:transcriptional regulator with XRE-family HTH domain